MSKYKLPIGLIALAILILLPLHGASDMFTIQVAHAASPLEKPLTSVAEIASYIIVGLNILGFIALKLLEFFLDPGFLGHPSMLGNQGRLWTIWQLSRDIMNLLFAAMLIGMAFYTIVKGNSEKIKEYIGRFVLAAVLVNFSWFFPRVIIDVANILTATVFSLPNLVTDTQQCVTFDGSPCTVITDVDVLVSDPAVLNSCRNYNDEVDASDPNANCKCMKSGAGATSAPICWWVGLYSETDIGPHSMINGLIVNFGRITQLSLVPKYQAVPGAAAQLEPAIDFTFFLGIFMSLIFAIAMIFPLVALAIGLIIRIIILWATIAFMPFTFLGFIVQGKLGTNVFGFEKDVWQEFIAAAFMPVLVAIPISIGFIMILAGATATAPVNFPIQFGGALVGGISDPWQLIWAFFALVIIWTGAFAALKKSEIIGNITEKIRNAGTTLGSTTLKLPLFTPIPVPGGKANLGQVIYGAKTLPNAIDKAILSGGSLGDVFSGKYSGGPSKDEVDGSRNYFNNNQADQQKVKDLLKTIADNSKTADQRNSARDELRELLKKSGIKQNNLDTDAALIEALRQLQTRGINIDSTDIKAAETKLNEITVSMNDQSVVSLEAGGVPAAVDLSGGLNQQTAEQLTTALNMANLDNEQKRDRAARAYEQIAEQTSNPEIKTKATQIAAQLKMQGGAPPEKSYDDIIAQAVSTGATPPTA